MLPAKISWVSIEVGFYPIVYRNAVHKCEHGAEQEDRYDQNTGGSPGAGIAFPAALVVSAAALVWHWVM